MKYFWLSTTASIHPSKVTFFSIFFLFFNPVWSPDLSCLLTEVKQGYPQIVCSATEQQPRMLPSGDVCISSWQATYFQQPQNAFHMDSSLPRDVPLPEYAPSSFSQSNPVQCQFGREKSNLFFGPQWCWCHHITHMHLKPTHPSNKFFCLGLQHKS